MIVTAEDDGFRIVTQADHARLAADILALWRADGLPHHPRREALLEAVREHDCGWWEADSAPTCVDGAPVDFRHVSPQLRLEVWTRAVERLEDRPYAALLAIEHAKRLHPASEDATYAALHDALDEAGAALRERVEVAEAALAEDAAWLRLADTLSLALCGVDFPSPHARVRWDASPSGTRLDPFPLAGATSFALPTRRIPDRRYSGDADLGVELATARWVTARVTLTAA